MEECVRCHEIDEDRRTLWMRCLYEMNELTVPFEVQYTPDVPAKYYTLRVCKRCRADWLEAIQTWFHTPVYPEDDCGSGIYVRRFGDTIQITEEEFKEKYG